MSRTLQRIRNNLQRPLPDLLAWLWAKVMSWLWKQRLQRVGSGFHIGSGALIQGADCFAVGEHFNAGQQLWIEAVKSYADFRFTPRIAIGDRVVCSQNVHVTATRSVTIGDGVLFGSRVHVTDHSHGTYRGATQDSPDLPPARRAPSEGRPVVIEDNVWLGDGVVVLPGVTIGYGSIIGANSVVSRDIPARVIAVGAPAVPVKHFDAATGTWVVIPPLA